ncbi:MAG: hypothetical protein AB7T59_16605 [Hyphomonadaceae bacterium]
MSPDPATITRTAPLAFWRIAEAFLHLLTALFGAPEHIAARHSFTHRSYVRMMSWLRAGEALLRRLLAIEAAAYAKPNTRALLRSARKRTRRAAEFWPEKPQEWRVSFRCFASATDRPRTRGGRGPSAERRFHDAWPAALRFEALIRAFNDPQTYARRIARRLHANIARLTCLLHAPDSYQHRVDCAAAITSAVHAAWPMPDSS